MKGKRRHELKTNDLAQALNDLRDFFQSWGAYVGVGALIVIVVAIIVGYMGSARAEAIDQAYTDLLMTEQQAKSSQQGPRTDAEIQQTLDKVADLAQRTNDEAFKVEALTKRGDLALNAAMTGAAGIRPEFLDEAASAFESVVERYQAHILYYGKALYGLYLVEANRFAVDNDSTHRQKASTYLEKIRDDARLAGTPYAKLAVDGLNSLDQTFEVIQFPKAPPQAPIPAVIDVDTPLPMPSGFAPADLGPADDEQGSEAPGDADESGQSVVDEPSSDVP